MGSPLEEAVKARLSFMVGIPKFSQKGVPHLVALLLFCVLFVQDSRAQDDNPFNLPEGARARLWEADSGTRKATLEGHTDEVFWVAFSPNEKTLASASDDGTILLWDMAHVRLNVFRKIAKISTSALRPRWATGSTRPCRALLTPSSSPARSSSSLRTVRRPPFVGYILGRCIPYLRIR